MLDAIGELVSEVHKQPGQIDFTRQFLIGRTTIESVDPSLRTATIEALLKFNQSEIDKGIEVLKKELVKETMLATQTDLGQTRTRVWIDDRPGHSGGVFAVGDIQNLTEEQQKIINLGQIKRAELIQEHNQVVNMVTEIPTGSAAYIVLDKIINGYNNENTVHGGGTT